MPPGTSKRKAQKQISYQEVDSDYDMDSEEEEKLVKMKGKGGVGDELEDKKKVGDTYGTTRESTWLISMSWFEVIMLID